MTGGREARSREIRGSTLGKAGLAGWEEMNRLYPPTPTLFTNVVLARFGTALSST